MDYPRESKEFKKALIAFLDASFAKDAIGGQIYCPCKKCSRRYFHSRDEVYDHVIVDGLVKGFKEWDTQRTEASSTTCDNNPTMEEINGLNSHDDIFGLLCDTFRDVNDGLDRGAGVAEEPNEEARKFYKLVEEGKQELYPGCKTFSKLAFIIRLLLFKCLNGISNAAFGDLLELLLEAFPMVNLPKSFEESKKIVRDLGLDYKRIHACPNDCILYRKDLEGLDVCPKCEASRWKSNKVPAKVLRYFPLKPRLQRLFMCSKTSEEMVWHDKKRTKDVNNIGHPADAQSWKDFDSSHSAFASDPRNVRLALASDGFNPFRTMSVAHSTWPVVLINYNLPPWLSMKPEYFMLSMLIPGPKSPGHDIDIFLQPLIEELKELWEDGVETYDAFKKQSFHLRAALMGTINDFPAYSMLSGWSTKGKYACPTCNYDAIPEYLHHSKKNCYMGHRRFLHMDHPWRKEKTSFDGKVEERCPPTSLSGAEILEELENFENNFGKTKKAGSSKGPWKKKSIFLELEYWHGIKHRHNLDVMHIEKNVFDNIIGTLLDIPGKTKDHVSARLDLVDLHIKPHLHPYPSQDGKKLLIPPATFSMDNAEKDLFLKVLKEAKLPCGYASNIARCVQLKERRFVGYKSHDAHVLLHHLLQVSIRKTLPKGVAVPLIRLGKFFQGICRKVVNLKELDKLATEIIEILCQFEMIFPPAFFDVMIHLPVHLVDEIKFGGPVQYRWMYFVERYLCKLKSYVRNRSQPEACIAQGYWMEECLTFCSRYMHVDVKTRMDRRCARNFAVSENEGDSSFFPTIGHPIGRKRKGKAFSLDFQSLKQAHRYAIFNCKDEKIDQYIEEHKDIVNSQHRKRRWNNAQCHSNDFIDWFQEKVQRQQLDGYLFWLAKGPNSKARKYSGYFVNGYRFYTKQRDSRLKTQNSGVILTAVTSSFASSRDQNPVDGDVTYYGVIEDIIELDFWSQFSVVLFRCDWFLGEVDDFGLTFINTKKRCSKNDPFVLATQVHQVYYTQDGEEFDIHYVMQFVPRDIFGFEEATNAETYWNEPKDCSLNNMPSVDANDNVTASHDIRSIDVNEILEGSDEPQDDVDYDDTDWDWMHASDDHSSPNG